MSVQVKGSGTIGGLDEGLVVSGIVTSSTQINVGSNIKLGNAGVVTATSFVGSGANLTSLPSQVTINNASGNRVITSDGGTTLNGEDTLRYDGTNFLIGTNTEAPYNNRNLTVAAGGSGSTTVAIEIRSPSNGNGRVIFSDGTSADSSANEGQVIYQQVDHKMLFGVAANYQNMALESTGGTGADLNLIDGNLKFASGHGIDFSATANSSGTMSSELLDDYEEGSWTPVLQYYGSSWQDVTMTTYGNLDTPRYVKIGRMVHATFNWNGFQINGSHLAYPRVRGLPFVSTAYGSCIVSYQNCFANVQTQGGWLANGQVSFEFYHNGASWNTWSGSSGRHFQVSCTYQAS